MYPNSRKLLILLFFILLIFSNVTYAWEDQHFDLNTLSSLEQDYLKQAETCFDDDDFVAAQLLYQKLSSELTNRNVKEIPPFIHYRIGEVNLELFNYDSAFDNFSLVVNNPTSSKQLQAKTLSALGEAYGKLGENNLAHEYFIKVIELREEAGDEEGLSSDLYALGSLFFYQNNYIMRPLLSVRPMSSSEN